MDKYTTWLHSFLKDLGLSEYMSNMAHAIINILLYIAFVLIVGYILHKLFVYVLNKISASQRIDFQEFLRGTNFAKYLSYLVPLMVMLRLTDEMFDFYPAIAKFLTKVINMGIILLIILIISSIINGIENYLRSKEQYKDKPLQSYSQVIQIFVWVIGLMALFNYGLGGDKITFGALGAASAVLMLIFKDTILGFVASIQISINDMVRIGDWIEFTKYGADGFVTNINLTTVTVENWNKTYSTIPTYSLVSDSFKNWRGMYEKKARRIKRAIFIKQSSVRFLTDEDLERLKKVERISLYIEHRQAEIKRYNENNEVDKSVIVNGRNQTNIGLFKKYMDVYLREQTALNFDFTVMVRNLDPTPLGIPVEVYCFSSRTVWVEYEAIQNMIIDHMLASLSYFDLEVYERTSTEAEKNFDRL